MIFFGFIITIVIYYRFSFDYSQQEELYNQAVQEIYKVQAELFDNVEANINSNYTLCLNRDSAKLMHPDSVLKDIYGQRDTVVQLDSGIKILKKKFFNSNPLNKRMNIKNHTSQSKYNQFIHKHIINKVSENCLFEKDCYFYEISELRDKPKLAENFRNYYDNLLSKNASQECLKYAKFMKPSYLLTNVKQCQEIFQILNTHEYKQKFQTEGIKYILKGMGHAGVSVKVLDEDLAKELNQNYQNGDSCGLIQTQQIIQEYILNPLLRNGKKAELRLFFVLTSNYPNEAFLYKDIIVKRSFAKYDPLKFTKQAHLCHALANLPYQKSYYSSASSIDDYIHELYSQGLIDSLDWKDKYFIPQAIEKFAHMIRSGTKVKKDTARWQHISIDLLIDTDLNLWILEMNTDMILHDNYLNSSRLHFDFCEDTYRLLHKKVVKRYQQIKNFIDEVMVPRIQQKIPTDEQLRNEIKIALVDPPLTQQEVTPEFIKVDFEGIQQECD